LSFFKIYSVLKGDTELDSKLATFQNIEESIREIMFSSRTLHISTRAISNQDIQTTRFLMEFGVSEESSVHHACRKLGDAFKNNGQHWKELKESSERVQQDLITFYNKGIGELKDEIEEMEDARTDYRAALSWLRATSVDPDKLGQIEKFRRVQMQVKSSKERFDKLKWAIQTKIDLLRVSRAALLSNSMSPLYKKELELSLKLREVYQKAAGGITETTVGEYDYKILKELRHDYDGEIGKIESQDVQDSLVDIDNDQFQEDMLLLDISDAGSQTTEGDRLISDFLGTSNSPNLLDNYTGSDLLSGFMIQSLTSDETNAAADDSHTSDLMQIFQEHDEAMKASKNTQQFC